MKIAKTVVLAASALALAVGSAWAADADKPMDSKNKDGKLSKTEAANASRSDESGFARLDKNKDGYISKAEAKGELELSKNFDKWDLNHDGKINRAEYLAAMAKEDTGRVVDKVKDKFSSKEDSSGGSSKPAK
jgi:Ca2+-binding EF-hand superfamily protein